MNKIPKGYKQTEIGIIPEDWDVKLLGEIVDIDVDNLTNSTDPEYRFKYISLEDVDNGVLRNTTEMIFFNAPSRARRKIKKNDILISTVRPNLKSHLWFKDDVNNLVCSTGFSVLRCKKNIIPGYIFNHFFSRVIENQIDALITGSNYPAINSKEIKLLYIPLPSNVYEQSAIAEVLSDTDELIGKLEELIAKKRKIKEGAMQELLTGKKRLPGFSGKWEIKKVCEIGTVLTGGTPPTEVKEYWNGTISWVTPTDIDKKKDIYSTERKITEKGLKIIGELPVNSVLVTCIASIGKNVILKVKGACNQQINAIITNENFNFDYIYYLIENNKKYLLGNSGITATNIISKKDFEQILFYLPLIAEQTAIAEILSDMDAEIEQLEAKLEKYKKIKLGMMHELLTGKTRLI